MKHQVAFDIVILVIEYALLGPIGCWPISIRSKSFVLLRLNIHFWIPVLYNLAISVSTSSYTVYKSEHDAIRMIKPISEVVAMLSTLLRMLISKIEIIWVIVLAPPITSQSFPLDVTCPFSIASTPFLACLYPQQYICLVQVGSVAMEHELFTLLMRYVFGKSQILYCSAEGHQELGTRVGEELITMLRIIAVETSDIVALTLIIGGFVFTRAFGMGMQNVTVFDLEKYAHADETAFALKLFLNCSPINNLMRATMTVVILFFTKFPNDDWLERKTGISSVFYHFVKFQKNSACSSSKNSTDAAILDVKE